MTEDSRNQWMELFPFDGQVTDPVKETRWRLEVFDLMERPFDGSSIQYRIRFTPLDVVGNPLELDLHTSGQILNTEIEQSPSGRPQGALRAIYGWLGNEDREPSLYYNPGESAG